MEKVRKSGGNILQKNPIDHSADKVTLLQKIEVGEKEIENGEGIDWEDMKKEIDLWLK